MFYPPMALHQAGDQSADETDTSKGQTAIDAADVHVTYDDGTEAVRGVSLDVEDGEFFGFLGPNGAGKTTTIRTLATLLSPHRGQYESTATIRGRTHRPYANPSATWPRRRVSTSNSHPVRTYASPVRCTAFGKESARPASRNCSTSSTCETLRTGGPFYAHRQGVDVREVAAKIRGAE